MKLEKVEYAGWKNCLRLSNGHIELVITLDVGPRVIRLAKIGGQNLFKEFADQIGKTGGDEWNSFGGHRLWHAPEVMPRTYYPDNQPVAYEWDETTLRLVPPEEKSNQLQLSIDITLDPDAPCVSLNHHITNTGVWDIELAPWCLSVMAGGGRLIVPQEEYIAHGDSFSAARPLVLWHFTKMNDPRFTWGEEFIQMTEEPIDCKQKFGARNSKGWAAYLLNQDVFIKRFPCIDGATYPDMNCNCEFYTEPGFLEVETLAPLSRITPGATASHPENWYVGSLSTDTDEKSLKENIQPHLNKLLSI